MKFEKNRWNFENKNAKIAKLSNEIYLHFWIRSGAKVCESCRSRKSLQNEPLVAIVAVHTAENEPVKVWGTTAATSRASMRRSPLQFSPLGASAGGRSCLSLGAIIRLKLLFGSFSAVWTATIARKDAFCRDFRDLQDLHSFAPL